MLRLKRTLMKNETVNTGLLVLAEGWLLLEKDGLPRRVPDEILSLNLKFLAKTWKV